MSETRLTVKRGVGADSERWVWFLDIDSDQVAQGIEDTRMECFEAAQATDALVSEAVLHFTCKRMSRQAEALAEEYRFRKSERKLKRGGDRLMPRNE